MAVTSNGGKDRQGQGQAMGARMDEGEGKRGG